MVDTEIDDRCTAARIYGNVLLAELGVDGDVRVEHSERGIPGACYLVHVHVEGHRVGWCCPVSARDVQSRPELLCETVSRLCRKLAKRLSDD